MEVVKRLRTLALEVFKTLNNINPEYMEEIFHKSAFSTHSPLNFEVNENHTTKYGNKSLRCLGPHTWKFLKIKLKKKLTTLSSRNFLLTIGLA